MTYGCAQVGCQPMPQQCYNLPLNYMPQSQQQCYIPQVQQCYIAKEQESEYSSEEHEECQSEYQDENHLDESILREIEECVKKVCGTPRKPQVKKEIIHCNGKKGKELVIRRRCPTPQPDIIERIKIVHPGPDKIKLIVEKPSVPPPIIKTKKVLDKKAKPKITKEIVCVPPSGSHYPPDVCYEHEQETKSKQQECVLPTSIPTPIPCYGYAPIPANYSYGTYYPVMQTYAQPPSGYVSDC